MKAILIVISAFLVLSCNASEVHALKVSSPNNILKVSFNLSENGQPFYRVVKDDKVIIDASYLGFELKNKPALDKNFIIKKSNNVAFNETWQMPWGEQLDVVNNYNELKIELEETSELNRKLNIVFKVYDDGIGFRYEFPEQENWDEVLITEERTQFNLTEDYKTFWTPGDWDIYEHLYSTTKLSEIDALKYLNQPVAQTYIANNAVNTPVTMVGNDGIHLSFHEAALINYSGMTLKVDTKNLSLESHLVGSKNTNYKVKRNLPFNTPWRTIQITDNATDLIESNLIVNLNEPNKIGDVSWFKPMKYTGVWWEMHLGKSSWDMASGKHGATTENVRKYIDFSAKNNIKGVLVEGWNTGWASEEDGFDFVTPYSDYDLKEVLTYGKEKGVNLIMHHETYGDVERYIKQQDTAYALMQNLGIHSVKTGYVGNLKPNGEYHHGQFMVNHYNNTVEKAAKYQIAINAHEPIKPTGLRRTYPNTISREGLRGQEFSIWGLKGGNPPEHLPIVAFTRMLAGPIDYTPGIFNIKFDEFKKENQVNTTLAQQLALYVVIYSPIQMAADLIEHYEANLEPLKFIKDVGVDWSETKVLNGEVGDYVTIARKERLTDDWFLGSITDENARTFEISLDFLDDNQDYIATVYKDGKHAHWDTNPLDIKIETITVNSRSKLTLELAEGGGTAISIIKKD
ncbi:glycoside hydrolase family 97 protein [Psychroserpens ponticola]|uniref:Glycoside hydrolase family 97 protein n=1 Tax=Psychroserpens ponticola TaxID=2932268 RepID=A0ABY7RVV9_9FLAO|nr:glycoside hydrolase family 97 protein [Psychroserpens ponticola]WCO01255.1 glycoside hydrolase family 97 protein [Psychroserpens ponticola]